MSPLRHIYVLLFAVCAIPALTLTPATETHAQSTIDKPLEDPADEARALALHKLLRCLVCQNQSISDSNAELARDLRVLVRQRIGSGDSDEETMAYIVDRYGDWVLLDPPVKSTTYVLWFGPVAIFLLALIGVVLFLRRSKIQPAKPAASLSTEEEAKLKSMLADRDGTDK
jgi:cytochrome c-type biogenesis protein CcmH